MRNRFKMYSWVVLIVLLFSACEKKEYAPNEIELVSSNGLYFIELKVNGNKGKFLLDTGANLSYVDYRKLGKYKLRIKDVNIETELTGIGGTAEKVYHLYEFDMTKNSGVELPNNIEFRSTDLSKTKLRMDGIIGWDYLKKNKAVIDYNNNTLVLNSNINKDTVQ